MHHSTTIPPLPLKTCTNLDFNDVPRESLWRFQTVHDRWKDRQIILIWREKKENIFEKWREKKNSVTTGRDSSHLLSERGNILILLTMGKPFQLLEMHSMDSTVEDSKGGYGYRDSKFVEEDEEEEEGDLDCDEEISPALHHHHTIGQSSSNNNNSNYSNNIVIMEETRRSKIMIVTMAFTLFVVACLAMMVGVFHGTTPGGSGIDAGQVVVVSPNTQIIVDGDSQESQGSKNIIIEFTVANLNTNAKNCTYIQDAHDLQCTPTHDTSTNKFRILLHPEWAPIGVERFIALTTSDFWQDVKIFRVVPNFIVQFGISSNPNVQKSWSSLGPIQDDPVTAVASNVRGSVTFATSGPNSRTTQIFFNTNDNSFLDGERNKSFVCTGIPHRFLTIIIIILANVDSCCQTIRGGICTDRRSSSRWRRIWWNECGGCNLFELSRET